MQRLTLTQPDDWHLHLRDGAVLKDTVPHSARQFNRAIVMPNLKPPVTTVAAALEYRQRILKAVPDPFQFEPLMVLYLTESTSLKEIEAAAADPHIMGFKLYPAGATTHSEAGVSDLKRIYPLLESMEKHDLVLLVHGEATCDSIDIFDRERAFIDQTLQAFVQNFPNLRIVFEHLTTADAVAFVRSSGPHVAATITPQHLLYNRNALLAGGIKPHFYCLPVLKREKHRLALVSAATSGEKKFFLGTDSAPHALSQKQSHCGCAGCFSAPIAMELYAQAFEAEGKLENLESFASFNGPDFYRLPRNNGKIVLEKTAWQVPASYSFGDEVVIPLNASETLSWKLA